MRRAAAPVLRQLASHNQAVACDLRLPVSASNCRLFSSGAPAPARGRKQAWQSWLQLAVAGGLTSWLGVKLLNPPEEDEASCPLCTIALEGEVAQVHAPPALQRAHTSNPQLCFVCCTCVHWAGLPEYTREEVARHSSREGGGRVWVTYKDGVYDVTPFLDYHPGGGGRILQARLANTKKRPACSPARASKLLFRCPAGVTATRLPAARACCRRRGAPSTPFGRSTRGITPHTCAAGALRCVPRQHCGRGIQSPIPVLASSWKE